MWNVSHIVYTFTQDATFYMWWWYERVCTQCEKVWTLLDLKQSKPFEITMREFWDFSNPKKLMSWYLLETQSYYIQTIISYRFFIILHQYYINHTITIHSMKINNTTDFFFFFKRSKIYQKKSHKSVKWLPSYPSR